MRIMAGIIALICFVLIFVNWNTPLAAAYAVAFAGWLPHCFADREVLHGDQA